MARRLFEVSGVRRRNGQLATGVVYAVYSNEAGTTLADVSATSGGSAIAGSSVTTADIAGLGPASLKFWGPTDGTGTLYLRVPSDASLGVQKIEADPDPCLDGSIFDAKGDLIAASAADTAARLAVGANDTVLTADSTTGTGLKWAASSGGVSLAGTNTWTGVNTWTNASLFKSGRPWVDVRAYGTDTTAIDAAWAAASAAAATLYFSPGVDYTYNGSGLSGAAINCVGADADYVQITLGAGVYLFKPNNLLYQTHIEGITTVGGKGLLQHLFTGTNVQRHHTIQRCRFLDYTECAISSEAADMPLWRILNNQFFADNDDSTIGVALPTEPSGSIIADNSFLLNRVDIKVRQGGLSTYIARNDFVRFEATPTQPRMRIWFVPFGSATNAGTGAVIRDNKFGNENFDATDVNVVFADEDAASTNAQKMPVLGSASTGFINGHTYVGNKVTGAGGTARPFIYSTTPNVGGCQVGPNVFDGTLASFLLQFHTPPAASAALHSNRLGPALTVDGTVIPASDATSIAVAAAGKPVYSDVKRRGAGDLTLNSTSWIDLDTALDITLKAQPGDKIEVALNGLWDNGATNGYLDAATWVSGAPVHYFSNGGATLAGSGMQGWAGLANATPTYENFSGSSILTLVSGDLSAGTVTVRLRAKTLAAVNKVLFATADLPLVFTAKNLGPG